MTEETKNPAAVELGKLGGKKTAERGPEYYAEINAQRKVKAGGRPRNPPKAIRDGTLKIGRIEIPCAVLEDETRVLTQAGFLQALGRSPRPAGTSEGGDFEQIPAALRGKAIQPFISDELRASSRVLNFIPLNGGLARGFRAELLPKVCDVFLKAREAGELPHNQQHIAKQCELLVRGLAHTGIIALVDEATGYQNIRDREALQVILDTYLRKEFAAWAKRFPDEFYEEMFRLRGWAWKGMKVNRPQVVGHYTNDLVWDRIAPGLRKELEAKNPKNDRGQRRFRHPQWLTEDIGDPALAQHLYALMGFMRVCPDGGWTQFYGMVQIAFPKKGDTLMLPLQETGA
jgi:hypothetical protein